MKPVRALFWDIGGVLLTNAWDHDERARAVERFRLPKEQFESLHKAAVQDLEEGKISLDQYLDRTVFQQPQHFSRQEFKEYMYSLSQPKTDVLEFARALANRHLMATINNESRELNEHRLRQFGLPAIFDLFVSSCYVGLRKPDERIYRLAMDLIQKAPEECCFIDDRPPNIDAAAKVGMRTILMRSLTQLQVELQAFGVQSSL